MFTANSETKCFHYLIRVLWKRNWQSTRLHRNFRLKKSNEVICINLWTAEHVLFECGESQRQTKKIPDDTCHSINANVSLLSTLTGAYFIPGRVVNVRRYCTHTSRQRRELPEDSTKKTKREKSEPWTCQWKRSLRKLRMFSNTKQESSSLFK